VLACTIEDNALSSGYSSSGCHCEGQQSSAWNSLKQTALCSICVLSMTQITAAYVTNMLVTHHFWPSIAEASSLLILFAMSALGYLCLHHLLADLSVRVFKQHSPSLASFRKRRCSCGQHILDRLTLRMKHEMSTRFILA